MKWLLALLVLILAAFTPFGERGVARAAFDPELRFYTLETPHFRVTYHSGLERVAQHVASSAESIQGNLAVMMGYTPTKDKTDILLTDTAESANGSAAALPYNAIRLIVTAPEDFSPLGDVDDWYVELVTHEYTHILHTDHIRGIPALVNAVLGKTLAPNQVQPRWILEGLGVYQESARTSAGRLRNSQWDMFLRADVLENNIATLDEISNSVRRWPQGNLFYLYGSTFIEWIAETYGEEALRKISYDYGGQLIPWGIQRSIRRATGKTYDELYPEWIAYLKAHYGAQANEIRAKGLRQGRRLTTHGQIARYPRWIPDNAWPEHKGGLLYYKDDQHTRAGLVALDLHRDERGNVIGADERHSELMARTLIESFSSFRPDGGLVFSSSEFFKNVFLYGDIESMEPGAKSPYGADGARTRLTDPVTRAVDPTIAPDGRRIVFTQNHAGTRSIWIGDLESGSISHARPLVPTAFLEQSFTPRWSPDGTHVAYTVWKHGGYRDIRYVDVRDGSWQEITNDRAFDGEPSFSSDGRYLLFNSDRTGVMNVYAYEIATGKLRQVTNVLSGAYSPEVSPDGKSLAYVGYGKAGFDLWVMPFDESTWTDAEPYADTHPAMPHVDEREWPSHPYSPWHTLMPRRYSINVTGGAFGEAVVLTATGGDLTGLQGITATSTTEIEKPELQGSLAYSYAALPFDFTESVFRTITPRSGYALGNYRPTVVQENAGISSTLTYTLPRAFDSQSFVVSHSLARTAIDLPMPIDKLDPYETPVIPQRGLSSTLHLAYSFSNSERYLWSVGPERGFSVGIGVDMTGPELGSDFSGFATNGDFTTYVLMPWLKHHSLALHAGGGTSGGNFPGRGAFFVGGYTDLPLVDSVRNNLIQGGLVLRGYAPVSIAGRSYVLTNAEYRFPIINLDRGDTTLPIFLNRITGAVFADYGSAFDFIDNVNMKTGVGAELWFDTTLGYVAPYTFRVGYARGLASGGIDRVYFVMALPF